VVVPLNRFPAGARVALEALPIAALAEGLRGILQQGDPLPWRQAAILGGWAIAAGSTFRWD
jgi:ABC-2 type transport system permease protein